MAQNGIKGHEGRKRVFLVEEHAMFRRGLSLVLADDPGLEVCCEMATPAGALEAVEVAHPDMLIVGMPTKDAAYADLVRRAGERYPELPILVMTDSLKSRQKMSEPQREGVASIGKQEDISAVLDAVRRLFAGERQAEHRTDTHRCDNTP